MSSSFKFAAGLPLPAHSMSSSALEQELATRSDCGLSEGDAKLRRKVCGKNTFDDVSDVSPFASVVHQIANAMVIVLLAAIGASFVVGFWIEGSIIAVAVILNAAIGISQEIGAKRRLKQTRSYSLPTASVTRAGRTTRIPNEELVPGDIVNLTRNDTVPADIRLINSVNLETNEALLTGESFSVRKDDTVILDKDIRLGDRLNVAFCSSLVTQGHGRGIVFATAARTEIGMVVSALQVKGKKMRHTTLGRQAHMGHSQTFKASFRRAMSYIGSFLGINVGTPLQIWLHKLATLLFVVAVACALITFAANSKPLDTREILIYAVATGLSIIPASLSAVLAITLAAGIRKMANLHVIVHKLHSIEALGSVTDICLDKTGTLTQAKMLAKIAWIPARGSYIPRPSIDPLDPEKGDLLHCRHSPVELDKENRDQEIISNPMSLARQDVDLEAFLTTASLASPARVRKRLYGWEASGDPTDIALQVLACRFDWDQERLTGGNNPEWTRIAMLPFDSVNKKMSVVFANRIGKQIVCTKGATEHVLEHCTHVNWGGSQGVAKMTEHFHYEILANMECLAGRGFRVLAFASKEVTVDILATDATLGRAQVEGCLTFQGLVGLFDPERFDSTSAVRKCHRAGVIVRMLTGDHLGTAEAIATQVGILPSNLSVQAKCFALIAADSFDKLTNDEIDQLPTLPLVIARCSPHTKVRMVEALQRREGFVAMVGDGVNDAQALKQANIGIAMSQSSDFVKGISEMVLTNDSLTSIFHGIKDGRRMFDNIQRFVLHLLSENIAQACILLIGLVFKDDSGLSVFPLAPVEILWVVIATSALPDMGLGFEAASHETMRRPPRLTPGRVITVEVGLDILIYGLWMAALCLSAFTVVLFAFGNGNLASGCNKRYSTDCDTVFRARATTFVCLVWFALLLSWELVDDRRSLFRSWRRGGRKKWVYNVWENKFLFWAVVAGFITIFPTLYIPIVNHVVFKHEGISWEWIIVVVNSILFLAGIEAWKWAKRVFARSRYSKKKSTTNFRENETSNFAELSENERMERIVSREVRRATLQQMKPR